MIGRRRRGHAATGSAALIVFVACAVFAVVSWPPLRHVDTVAAASGHRLLVHATALRQTALIVTDLGSPLAVDVVTVVAAGALLLTRHRRAAVAVVVARLGELATETVTKAVVNRPRPDVLPHLASASGTSFPSGHAAGSAAVYGAIALILAASWTKPGRVALLASTAVFVLAVGASRVLLGVHFPTDVVGGFALGVVWIVVAQVIQRSGEDPA